MTIDVKENRKIIIRDIYNTQNENDVEILDLSIPEKYADFNKKIVFITPNGVVWDLIDGDTYTLKRAITQYERVDFYIWLTKGNQDFRSVERTLILNKNHNVDGEVTPEDETEMERVISILESEITKVDNLDIDINKVDKTTTITLTDKNGNVKSVNILDGLDGDGRDGFSPIITETQTADGYDISITDKNGTKTISLLNGQDGTNGQDGADGISPILTETEITGGYDISITDKNGTRTISLYNGQNGTDGQDGKDGEDGQTGATGNGISSIIKTRTSGLIDTYTITYTNGNTTTFEVKNGEKRRNRTKSDKMEVMDKMDIHQFVEQIIGQIKILQQ